MWLGAWRKLYLRLNSQCWTLRTQSLLEVFQGLSLMSPQYCLCSVYWCLMALGSQSLIFDIWWIHCSFLQNGKPLPLLTSDSLSLSAMFFLEPIILLTYCQLTSLSENLSAFFSISLLFQSFVSTVPLLNEDIFHYIIFSNLIKDFRVLQIICSSINFPVSHF